MQFLDVKNEVQAVQSDILLQGKVINRRVWRSGKRWYLYLKTLNRRNECC